MIVIFFKCSFFSKETMAASTAVQVVASPFLGLLFDNLSSLIQKEVGSIWGVDKEMKKLASTLSTIRDVLEDAEEMQVTNKAVEGWLCKLKVLAYDADDILDEWGTEAMRLQLGTEHITCSKQVCVPYFSWVSFSQVVFRRKIAKRVNALQKNFDEIVLEKSGLGLRVGGAERSMNSKQCWNRETSSLLPDPNVYGRDEERDFIVRQILNNVASGEGVSVHPIVGIGGLGKTTLAQVCYNDHRVQEHFDVRVWVCVSDDFDVKRLTRAVINSIVGGTCNLEELDPLQRLLQGKLEHKRFLIVLDDVWNENQEEWRRFKNSLRCGAVGSSIIVTTRLDTVASITGTHAPLFLKLLSEDDCWSLFKQRAFGMGHDESPNLVKIGHEIVKKCGGLPLAAIVLGGLVRFKHREKEWLNVRDSETWELPQSDGNIILPALKLSYTHLAPHLRQCFAYCSVFPKGYRMRHDDLIRLWMANGFIQSKREMQMEDIGNEIFNELLCRSFFQDERKDSDGRVVSFMMHDLIHDLACSINMKECYHLAEETQTRDVHQETRHLSVNHGEKYYALIKSMHQLAPNLRTLLLLGNGKPSESINEVCLSSLRALSLKQIGVNWKVLYSLGLLKHLRYLNISFSGVKILPDSLSELINLQTFELESCYELEKLPEHMGNMGSLRHLNIRGCYKLSEMPVGMGKLIWLHTLSMFIVGASNGRRIKELQRLEYLSGEFVIEGLEHVRTREEAREANLMIKQNIVSLKLVWYPAYDMDGNYHREVLEGLQPHPNIKRLGVHGYKGLTFPSWLQSHGSSSPSNLGEISLTACSNCENLPSLLGILPLLKRLKIREGNSVKFFSADSDDDMAVAFPSLEYLQICGMDELEDWFPYGTGNSTSEQVSIFPHLQRLDIERCPELKRLPPSSLSSLERLYVSNCNPVILGSIQNLPSLSSLCISSFDDTTCFPENSLRNLLSLNYLTLAYCKNLESLPDRLQQLTNLQVLQTVRCHPELHRRCENETGEDWSKVAHIPRFYNLQGHHA